jgi:hypothetical protein
MRFIATLMVAGVLSGCVGNNFCAKRQECNNDLEDDSYAVCVEEFNSGINSLRANKEEECQDLANARLALFACMATLDCDDFEEGDLGGKCDDEIDDVEDAQNDANGECSSLD